MIQMITWALGYGILPILAFFIKDWFHLQIAMSIPLPFFVICYWFLPECPRWLYAKGKMEEFEEICKKAKKVNGQNSTLIPLKNFHEPFLVTYRNRDPKIGHLAELFKNSKLRKNTLIQCFNWFSVVFLYYGFNIICECDLFENEYLNFSVIGLTEIPVYLICVPILRFFGRKIPLALMYLTSGILLLITLTLFQKPNLMLLLVSLGKLALISIFALNYLAAVELFPTILRCTGLGIACISGQIGSFLAPIISVELINVGINTTFALFAVLSFISCIVTLCLPETKNLNLPNSVREGDELGENKSIT